MRRRSLAFLVGLAVSATHLAAQTSFDVLEQDLKEAKQKHDDAASEEFTNFMSSVDSAAQSGAVALDLFKRAGGSLPDATPVRSHYEYETPTEKALRQAQDEANLAPIEALIQEHCGLMHYAALLTLTPKAPALHEQWIAWLKSAAQVYPQMVGQANLKGVAMKDSVISKFLEFRGWGDSPQGGWTVNDLPRLFDDEILTPLRKHPTQETLEAWDAYISMRQTDQLDKNAWTQQDNPPLQFDRASDDFAVQPSMEKLQVLIAIIKDNPTHSSMDDWISRMRVMIKSYRDGRTTALAQNSVPGPSPTSPSSDSPGVPPAASPGTPSSAAAGTMPAATPGGTSSAAAGTAPAATPGTPSSSAAGTFPSASPGTPSSGSAGTPGAASPGTPSSAAGGALPAPTPGQSSSAANGAPPAPTPGTPSSAAAGTH